MPIEMVQPHNTPSFPDNFPPLPEDTQDTPASSDNTPSLPAASEVLDWGVFDVADVRDSNTHLRNHDLKFFQLSPKFRTPPTVILGLNSLETHRPTNTRITTYVDNVHERVFCANITTRDDSKLYRASCNWLAMPSQHPHFQAGNFHTREDPEWQTVNHTTHHKINFPHSYETPPTVVVWLNDLDFSPPNHEHVMATATNITTREFTVHVNTWGESTLTGAQVSWFAYPTGYPGICSGNLLPDHGRFGVVDFETKFASPPRAVLVGLNKLQTDKSQRCSFNIITEAVTEVSMGIRVEGWGDSIVHSAGVGYIAIE